MKRENQACDNEQGQQVALQKNQNMPVQIGKEVNRIDRSKRNPSLCFINRRFWSQRIGGFTLIELLVVITIITLLMGVFVPIIIKIREKAKQVESISKLKEVGIAIELYANDNGGRFPNITDLSQVPQKVIEALKPYVNNENIFRSPVSKLLFDYRVTHDPNTNLAGVRLDLIRHPEKVIIAGEQAPGWQKSGMMYVLYANGHVAQVTEEEWWKNITTPVKYL